MGVTTGDVWIDVTSPGAPFDANWQRPNFGNLSVVVGRGTHFFSAPSRPKVFALATALTGSVAGASVFPSRLAMFDDARVLCALGGFLVLAHACYAVISYRDELKIAGDEFEGVPVQVAVECAIGAAMCAWGALGFAGEFMPIAAQPRELPPDNLEKMGDFVTFNHRGTARRRKRA